MGARTEAIMELVRKLGSSMTFNAGSLRAQIEGEIGALEVDLMQQGTEVARLRGSISESVDKEAMRLRHERERIEDIETRDRMLEKAEAYAVSLRKFIEALPCPDPRCSDGSIISTGPDPQNDACEWCYMRHMLLNESQSGHEIGTPQPARVISHYDDEAGNWVFAENWHAIEGPNGLCACGQEKGKCGERLAAFIKSIRPEGSHAVGTGYDALNALSKQHGEVFNLAVEFRDTLCRTLDKAEIYGRQGKPLPQDEIDAMTARLADTTERLYGPGREVPPHRSGGGQMIPSQVPKQEADRG